MAKVIGFDHLAVSVSDMDECKKFFVEGLGLKKKADYGNEFFMELPDSRTIALFKGKNEKSTIHHLALKVDDLNGIKKKLKKLGYRLYKGTVTPTDMVEGPNGLIIELVP